MPQARSGRTKPLPQAEAGPRPIAARADRPGLSDATLNRLEAMRRHLTAARPTSGNEALKLLRSAFPEAPLAERVEAAGSLDRYGL